MAQVKPLPLTLLVVITPLVLVMWGVGAVCIALEKASRSEEERKRAAGHYPYHTPFA
jgi:hypothetical protein